MMRCSLVLTVIALLGAIDNARGQEPAYVEDLRFVQALRQNGDTDLALDLLGRLEKTASPQLMREIPFERALTRKAEALNETDSRKRLDLYNQARADLIKFRDNNPNHPRIADVKIDIADIAVLEARVEMSKAMAQEGVAAQLPGLEIARQKFEAAGKELQVVYDELNAQLTKLPEPKTPVEKAAYSKLEQTKLRAELSLALNLFNLAQTIPSNSPKNEELVKRGKQVQTAVTALQKVASQSEAYSEVWQAQAWLGRCEHELGKPGAARERYIPIITSTTPASADGRRLARYFRLLVIQESPQADKGENVNTIVDGCTRWLTDYPRFTATAEGYGIRFLLAEAYITLGSSDTLKDAAKKKEYLDKARKELAELSKSENEFNDRARQKTILIIGAEGGFAKPVSQLKTFEDCYVRAQYEIAELTREMKETKDLKDFEKKRETRIKAIEEALSQGLSLRKATDKPTNDVNNARAMVSFYAYSSRNYKAAIDVGEKFARDDPKATQAALAAIYALKAYYERGLERERLLNVGNKDDLVGNDGKPVDEETYKKLIEDDRKKLVDFAEYCEKRWPKEQTGNLARHLIGLVYVRNKEPAKALKVLSEISTEYEFYLDVQYYISEISFNAEKDGVPPFADGVPHRERGMKMLRTMTLPAGAAPEVNQRYLMSKSKLGEELYRDKKYDEMEKLVQPLLVELPKMQIGADEQKQKAAQDYFAKRLTKVLIYAKYGKADADFKANDFKKVSDSLAPMIDSIKADKLPQLKDDQQIARALLILALRANLQLNDLPRVKAVADVFGKTVGENPEEAKVPEILKQLVPLIRVQIRELKAKKDAVGLKRAVDGFTAILDDQNAKAKPSEDLFLILAQCYSSLEQHQKAIIELKKIGVDKVDKEPPKDAEAAKTFHIAQLLYVQQMRMAAPSNKKKEVFDDCHKLLDTWIGTNDKKGWANGNLDAHKERMLLFAEVGSSYPAGYTKASQLVKSLASKVDQGESLKNAYLECYYYMVYCLYMDGKDPTRSSATRADRTNQAAKLMATLEEKYKDFGSEESKRRFDELLATEPDLKVAFEKSKGK
jgi:hypothetical protein